MVLATLLITQPFGLAVALGLVLAVLGIGGGRAPERWRRRAVRASLAAVLLLIAILMAYADSPNGHLLLALLAGGVGLVLIRAMYHREDLTPRRRTVLVALRTCTWALLLIFLGRPACERTVVSWDRPVLPVLLDGSASMGLTDDGEGTPTRVQRANAALADSAGIRARLAELYDLRLRRFGAWTMPAEAWALSAGEPVTALAGALREAGEMRSARGRPAPYVLIVSDGAENAADAGAVRQAADELAGHHTAAVAVGVGPEAGHMPLVELEPLAVPPRVGLRDVLQVRVGARVQGCRESTVAVALLWDDDLVAAREAAVEQAVQPLECNFQVVPPSAGAHRLMARVTLPESLGGHVFTTTTIVDVVADRVRVLYLERVPHPESAFTTRVWRRDARFEVTRQTLGEVGQDLPARPYDWFTGFDVVVLGRGTHKLSEAALAALAQAVTERGVGLLLAGGREMLNGSLDQSPLSALCPTELSTRPYGYAGGRWFVPTAAGLRHPLLMPVCAPEDTEPNRLPVTRPASWGELPELSGAAALGAPKAVATVLAEDQDGHPLLAAQEVGRGRCVVAAWESTWRWALVSDAGLELHRRLWTQLAIWLANRRPSAWVVTDQPTYPAAALQSGQRRVRIRAGLSGLEIAGGLPAERVAVVTLQIGPHGAADPNAAVQAISLQREGDVWTAELPQRGDAPPTVGEYELAFSLRLEAAGDEDAPAGTTRPAEEFSARTRFVVEAQDLERQPPTANLALLRTVAERTRAYGGRYAGLAELGEVLEELAARDQRTRLALPVRQGWVDADPWGLLAWALVLLGAEWVIRKRSGLA